MASSAVAFRLMAHDPHALAALVEEGSLVQGLPVLAGDGCTAFRRKPWQLDKEKYKKRNEVERMFGRRKENRRVATRYDKLDATYFAFVQLAFIVIALRQLSVNTP